VASQLCRAQRRVRRDAGILIRKIYFPYQFIGNGIFDGLAVRSLVPWQILQAPRRQRTGCIVVLRFIDPKRIV
jgi:hypothetical protein